MHLCANFDNCYNYFRNSIWHSLIITRGMELDNFLLLRSRSYFVLRLISGSSCRIFFIFQARSSVNFQRICKILVPKISKKLGTSLSFNQPFFATVIFQNLIKRPIIFLTEYYLRLFLISPVEYYFLSTKSYFLKESNVCSLPTTYYTQNQDICY